MSGDAQNPVFPEILKSFRKLRGWSLRELARLSGLSNPILSQYENGYAEPKMSSLIKLADTFGVTIDELVGRKTR